MMANNERRVVLVDRIAERARGVCAGADRGGGQGARHDGQTTDGVSCLWIASQNGHVECVRALIEAGGKELVMMANKNGASCLWIASQNGHVECVRALIEAGGKELVMMARQQRRVVLVDRIAERARGVCAGADRSGGQGDSPSERQVAWVDASS